MKPPEFAVYVLPDDKNLRDAMLLYTASLYSGTDSRSFEKTVDNLGKPYFKGLEKLHFSISHSGEYWACAFASERVGFDLQRHDECRRESIAKRFFHKDEMEYLEARDFEAKEFFDIWAKKESFIKFMGQGLGMGLESFSVLEKAEDYEIRTIPFIDRYTLCLCAKKLGNIELHVLKSIDQ